MPFDLISNTKTFVHCLFTDYWQNFFLRCQLPDEYVLPSILIKQEHLHHWGSIAMYWRRYFCHDNKDLTLLNIYVRQLKKRFQRHNVLDKVKPWHSYVCLNMSRRHWRIVKVSHTGKLCVWHYLDEMFHWAIHMWTNTCIMYMIHWES